VTDQITYKLSVTVYKCLHGPAPDYRPDHHLYQQCRPTSVDKVADREHLCSVSRHSLVMSRFQLEATFTVAGPTTWNSLSDDLRDPDVTSLLSHES